MKLAKVLREIAKPEEERTPKHAFNLLDELHKYLISPDAREQRASGSFNPSGLEGCKRAMAYNYLRAPVNDVHLEPRLIITFQLGNHIHDRFQWMFAKVARRKGWDFLPEHRIIRTLNPWFISGRCDGVFLIPDAPNEGLEVKSIHKAGFDRLYDVPLLDHQYQGNTYCGLLKIPRMHYLYICKDNSQIKVFSLPFDREMFNDTVGKIERILLKLQDGKLPKRITPDCKDPKCKFREVCWSDSTVERLMSDETREELADWKPTVIQIRGIKRHAA